MRAPCAWGATGSVATSALLAALAGCLSAPTGQPAALDASTDAPIDGAVDGATGHWPQAGAHVVALAAGRVDADSLDDLIVVDDGSHAVYLLQGGADVDPGHAGVDSFTRRAPIADLRAPAAALAVSIGAARVVVLDNPASGPRLSVFAADLAPLGQATIPHPTLPAGAVVTLASTMFGQPQLGGTSVFVSLPDAFYFVDGTGLLASPPAVVPPPTPPSTALTSVRAVGAYVAGGEPRVFVSEELTGQRATATAPWTWTPLRNGPSWPVQAVVPDVTADGRPDVVALQPGTGGFGQVCVLDVDRIASDCAAATFPEVPAAMTVGPLVGAGGNDVVVLDVMGQPAHTTVRVIPDLRVTAGDATIAPTSMPYELMPYPDPRMALAQLDGAGGKELVTVSAAGDVRCLRFAGTAPAPCAP